MFPTPSRRASPTTDATIGIHAIGSGGGPLSTLTITRTDATTVTLPDGGRNVDRDGNGVYDHPAGSLAEGLQTLVNGPDAIVLIRDGLRQTVVDLIQLASQIEAGIDVNGDNIADLDANRISYLGSSLGSMYGTGFVAVEPGVRAAILNTAGGPPVEVARLNAVGPFRGILGKLLASRVPSLLNGGTVPGAIAIQDVLDRSEWAMKPSDPVAYAHYLRTDPLDDVATRPVLFTFGQGDPVVANTTTAAILRAGNLADRTTYFRAVDAYAPTPPDAVAVHEFLLQFPTAGTPFATQAQQAIATFLASDGQVTIDPDGDAPLFETPIAGPLAGEQNP